MSGEFPYVTRLYWDGTRGVARLNGSQRVLTDCPVIEGLPRFTMLDLVPEVVSMIQPYAECVRDLFPLEREAAMRWLTQSRGLW